MFQTNLCLWLPTSSFSLNDDNQNTVRSSYYSNPPCHFPAGWGAGKKNTRSLLLRSQLLYWRVFKTHSAMLHALLVGKSENEKSWKPLLFSNDPTSWIFVCTALIKLLFCKWWLLTDTEAGNLSCLEVMSRYSRVTHVWLCSRVWVLARAYCMTHWTDSWPRQHTATRHMTTHLLTHTHTQCQTFFWVTRISKPLARLPALCWSRSFSNYSRVAVFG